MHQTFTKKMIREVPENSKIISIQPLPPSWKGLEILGVGEVVIIFHMNSVRGLGVGWTFSGVTKTLIMPRSLETKKCFCI